VRLTASIEDGRETGRERGAPSAGISPAALHAAVERARAGDVRSFETLYRAHVGRVYAVCLRMHGNREEAEDSAQEAFVRAWRRLPSFEGRSTFSSWLHRIA
jgi:RNA polymerase sigma-70 factor (ECF subfamily)